MDVTREMTREEAARIIVECKEKGFKYTFYTLEEYHTALDMAIKALEQEPCEDVISRQAVDILVDELARAISDERCCMSRGRSTATIMQDILDLPPVNPQNCDKCEVGNPCLYCKHEFEPQESEDK